MLDIGWTELLVIAVVLIVVVGPKDLPPMLRAFGKMTANLRKMAGEFRSQFDEALRESDLDDVRKTISDAQRLNPTNALRDAINPLRQMSQEIRSDLERATKVATSAGGAGADSEALEAGGHETGDAADAGLPASGLGLEPDPARPVTPDVTPAAAAIPVTSSEVAEPSVPAVAPSPSVPATASAPAAAAAAAAPSSPVAESSVPKPKATRKPAARPKAAPAPLQEATSADLAPVPVKRKGSTRKTLAGTGEPQAPAPKRAPRKTNSPKDDA